MVLLSGLENAPLCAFPGGSDGKESTYNVGDLGSIPGLGRSLGEGNGNPQQFVCLGNLMDREAPILLYVLIKGNLTFER